MATSGKRKRSILSVEDDPHASRLIRAILEADGHTVFTESTSQGAMKALAQVHPSIILLDVNVMTVEKQTVTSWNLITSVEIRCSV